MSSRTPYVKNQRLVTDAIAIAGSTNPIESNAVHSLTNAVNSNLSSIADNTATLAGLSTTASNDGVLTKGYVKVYPFVYGVAHNGIRGEPDAAGNYGGGKIYYWNGSWYCENSSGQGGLITTTNITGTTPSDDRLKHYEQPIPDGIATVKQLQPRHYIQTCLLYTSPSPRDS